MKSLSSLGLISVLALWVLSVVVGHDVVADVDPSRAGAGPSISHWLGCDQLGRDVLWRLITACESFVGPGLLACLLCAFLGVGMGGASGWLGGSISSGIRYIFSVTASLPRFVLVLLIGSIYGDDPVILALSAGLAYTPVLGEAVAGRIEAMRRVEFVEAAQAHGISDAAVLLRELLWSNCRALIGRHLLYLFGYFLVLETTLSYLGGFGVEEPQPSWGNMLAFSFSHSSGNPLAWLAPAVAIWLTVLATTLIASRLGEASNG